MRAWGPVSDTMHDGSIHETLPSCLDEARSVARPVKYGQPDGPRASDLDTRDIASRRTTPMPPVRCTPPPLTCQAERGTGPKWLLICTASAHLAATLPSAHTIQGHFPLQPPPRRPIRARWSGTAAESAARRGRPRLSPGRRPMTKEECGQDAANSLAATETTFAGLVRGQHRGWPIYLLA